MKKFIYKICYEKDWAKAKNKRKFNGAKKDKLDGYIHFSNKNQVSTTLKRYFYNKKDKLILLKVSTSNLDNLFWEKSRGGLLFPHLYSYLNLKDVKKIFQIILKKNGEHKLPANF